MGEGCRSQGLAGLGIDYGREGSLEAGMQVTRDVQVVGAGLGYR